ncbi:MAG: hypothetical protein KC462_01745 [Cyanobacteria bacterium HKST-UBA05]|nr:hypothetical protein [Cyanobacteria bacterium HKST-UBA05]
MTTPPFFTYQCDATDRPFCDRIAIMNLALDQVSDQYCLEVLAESQAMAPKAFFDRMYVYIQSRDCVKTPWEAFDPSPCPRMAEGSCFCTPLAGQEPADA